MDAGTVFFLLLLFLSFFLSFKKSIDIVIQNNFNSNIPKYYLHNQSMNMCK